MALEIERKFLVEPGWLPHIREIAVRRRNIVQGYLFGASNGVARVRISDADGWLTVKSRTRGLTRSEFEYQIPLEDAREMMQMCLGRVLEKTRWIVEFGGKTWEIDEFHGRHVPLVLAEIELKDEGGPFEIPPFIGDEVTGVPQYFNSNLANQL